MELRELNPFTNTYRFPVTQYTSCILRQEYLGILNLPLLSRLNECGRLLVSIDHEIEAIGPDGTSIQLTPLGNTSHSKLLAETPLSPPTRTNKWIPPRLDSKQILLYAQHIGLIKEGNKELELNIMPYPIEELIVDDGIVKAKEGGFIIHQKISEEQVSDTDVLNKIRTSDNKIEYSYKSYTLILRTGNTIHVRGIRNEIYNGLTVYSDKMQMTIINDKLYLTANKLEIEHEYYNYRIRYLQPLAPIEEKVSRATVESPIICMEPSSQESICMVSERSIIAEFYPGRILVSPNGPLHIWFSRKIHDWGRALDVLWFLVNKPIVIKASLKTTLWRITPYGVKPLYVDTEPIDSKRIRIRVVLWNSFDRFVQADIWFPGKILSAKSLDYEFREIEELIPDYDRVKTGIPPLGIGIIEIKLLRLPALLLRELMRRSMLSPYTPP